VAKSLQKKHWLVHVLRRAGIPGAEELTFDPGVPPDEAWTAACDTLKVSMDELSGYVADYFRLRVARLENAEPTALKLVPEKVARQYSVFPVKEDDRHLTVATSDPTDFAAEQALGFISGRKTVFEVAPPPFIEDFLNAAYSPDGMIETLLSRADDLAEGAVSVIGPDAEIDELAEADGEAAPVIKLANLIFRDAVLNGASEVHIEPGASGGTVRFRVDGVLRSYLQLPLPALIRVVSRIKLMAGLDIGDPWRPQEGRTRVIVEGRPYDIRISSAPTRGAEKVVLRLLKGGEAARLSEIGLPGWELRRLRQLLAHQDGLVCVVGPPESGKTTTLYAGIRELATGDVEIMTVEDPIEYELTGVTQIQVQPKRGVTFASAVRDIIARDPAVILVGEIRDGETAEAALEAVRAGHLVLATLLADDAVGVVDALRERGLDPPGIADALRGALAQRLVRKVCDECGEPIRGPMTDEEARLARRYNFRPPVRSVGCRRCAETGYRGRVPVQEVFLLNTNIAAMIRDGASHAELYESAVSAGMRSLLQVGLERVRSGVTTLDELERVLGAEVEEVAAVARAGVAGEGEVADRGPASDAAPTEPERLDLEPGTPQVPSDQTAESLEGIGVDLEPTEAVTGDPAEGAGASHADEAGPGEAVDLGGLIFDRRELGESLVPPSEIELKNWDPAAEGSTEDADTPGPVSRDSLDQEEAQETRDEQEVDAPGDRPPEEEAPILVVDDDPEDRLLLRTLLTKHGFQVQEAKDGNEALEMIGGGAEHSLIVLDLALPFVDGREVLGQLRSATPTRGMPVVVLTASSDPEDEHRLMESGADDYLRKPLDPARFIARVQAALRRARMT
jgi:type II secretory ATPase GspE/PulE/Tfp pilus assembly ATPase PilB-like protein/CheY-like chemotaxis protein